MVHCMEKEERMKVLMLNGSPRVAKSVTGKLLAALAAGLAAGGAEIRQFAVSSMKIAPCTGCLSCMHRTPGVCAIKDDMEDIYGVLKTADVLVVGTPVYVDGMSAQTKAAIDRSVACLQPFLTKDKAGRIRHPFNWRMPGRFLLVSTSGFPEPVTFDPLIASFRAGAANFGAEPIGEICVPGSIALQVNPDKLTPHLALIEELGRKLALTDGIDGGLMKKINTPPVTVSEYLEIAASYEQWCSEHIGKPKA
jgi:hypothetical protein